MVRFLILFFSFNILFASEILNITYFPNNNKIDVLFSLDKPFNGKISLIKENEYKITNLTLNRIEQKKFQNGLKIIITPQDNFIDFKINYNKKISIKASLTAKGYGLRLRLLGVDNLSITPQTSTSLPTSNNIPQFNWINYILVIVILIILIIILLIVKKKTLQKLPKEFQDDNYKILHQRMLDPNNKVVLFQMFNRKYLVLLGDKNNIILDRFYENKEDIPKPDISAQNSKFDTLLNQDLEKEFIQKASKLKKDEDEF